MAAAVGLKDIQEFRDPDPDLEPHQCHLTPLPHLSSPSLWSLGAFLGVSGPERRWGFADFNLGHQQLDVMSGPESESK